MALKLTDPVGLKNWEFSKRLIIFFFKETKKEFEAKRKGRAGRMAPVDFRPAPLVAPRGGGDRRRGGNRGDYKANKVRDR